MDTQPLPEPITRMLRHPDSNKVLSVIATDGFPHASVIRGMIVGDDDRTIYAGEAMMYRTSKYLAAHPKAEILVWKGKDGYTLKVVVDERLTEGPELDRINEMLERIGMHADALWVFTPTEVWDEGSSANPERVV